MMQIIIAIATNRNSTVKRIVVSFLRCKEVGINSAFIRTNNLHYPTMLWSKLDWNWHTDSGEKDEGVLVYININGHNFGLKSVWMKESLQSTEGQINRQRYTEPWAPITCSLPGVGRHVHQTAVW
jgi:hypothetical protein